MHDRLNLLLAISISIVVAFDARAASAAEPLPSSPATEPTGTVRGRVIIAGADTCAAEAYITVSGTRRGAKADEDGRFIVTDVPAGTQELRVQGPEIGQTTERIAVWAGNETNITLRVACTGRGPIITDFGAGRWDEDVRCEFHPARKPFRVGESPAFVVKLVNRGAHDIALVAGLDPVHSERPPYASIAIEDTSGGFEAASGSSSPPRRLSLDDFVTVKVDESFAPLGGGEDAIVTLPGKFTKPGRYRARFTYVTSERRLTRWSPGDARFSPEMRERFESVPWLDIDVTRTVIVEP